MASETPAAWAISRVVVPLKPRFEKTPMFLETPKGPELLEDLENLATLRSLLGDREPRAWAPPAPPGPTRTTKVPARPFAATGRKRRAMKKR